MPRLRLLLIAVACLPTSLFAAKSEDPSFEEADVTEICEGTMDPNASSDEIYDSPELKAEIEQRAQDHLRQLFSARADGRGSKLDQLSANIDEFRQALGTSEILKGAESTLSGVKLGDLALIHDNATNALAEEIRKINREVDHLGKEGPRTALQVVESALGGLPGIGSMIRRKVENRREIDSILDAAGSRIQAQIETVKGQGALASEKIEKIKTTLSQLRVQERIILRIVDEIETRTSLLAANDPRAELIQTNVLTELELELIDIRNQMEALKGEQDEAFLHASNARLLSSQARRSLTYALPRIRSAAHSAITRQNQEALADGVQNLNDTANRSALRNAQANATFESRMRERLTRSTLDRRMLDQTNATNRQTLEGAHQGRLRALEAIRAQRKALGSGEKKPEREVRRLNSGEKDPDESK